MGEEKREELMESLFGAQFEESEDDRDTGRAGSYTDEEEGEGEVGEAESEGEREEEASRRTSEDGGEEASAASARNREEENEDEAEMDHSKEGAARLRDAFGESDEEGQEEQSHKRTSPEEVAAASDAEGSEERDVKAAALVDEDEEEQSESEAERAERKKPKGEPLLIEVPLRPPPTQAHNMNFVRVSNIMDVEQKPFNPKTYLEEVIRDGLRLEDNVVRWRSVRNRDGSRTYESNARFVKWSDGSMQLLIGNEVLDLSVQDGQQDESHLFVRHPGNILQAQGKLARKMKFMPSSLSSKSHRRLTALVDSRHKKGFKVKNVITDFDPEKDKEQKEKAAEQRIKSREDLQKKQEKTMRKYLPAREREPQLSPGYLEGALEEEDEMEEYEDGRSSRRYQEQFEAESRAEARINHAKRQHQRDRRRVARNRRDMLDDEESDERAHRNDLSRPSVPANADEDEDDEADVEEEVSAGNEDETGRKRKDRSREEDRNSPPRKQAHRRRVVVSESDED